MQILSHHRFQNSPSINEVAAVEATGISVTLDDAGKRFNRDWIFRHISYSFQPGISYAITGPNGSGKSTLLQCIAGSIMHNEGTIAYKTAQNVPADAENIFKYIAIVAPYLELIEEMTATELLVFHAAFKPLLSTITIPRILETIGLTAAAHKQIRFYSSGMKQRIKLAQAVFSDTPLLLLDEPCTNLDTLGYTLYHHLIKTYCKNKLIIVSSNDVNEYDFCDQKISITDYK